MDNIKIKYGDDARQELSNGVKKIAKAVKITLGPSGKNVLIRNSDSRTPFATKDGVTVAGQVASGKFFEQMAIELMQEVANSSDASAGDGTTTATILAEAIFQLGTEMSNENTNILDVKRGIDIATAMVIEELKKLKVEYGSDDNLMKVAMISSNNDHEVSKVVTDAFKVAGKQGVVNIKRSKSYETYLTSIEGMNLETGYRSRYYVTDHANDIVEFDKPIVYITDKRISTISDNFNQLLSYISHKQIPLLIVCPDIDESVSNVLIENKTKDVLKVCVCKAPGFGDEQTNELLDMGTMLGKIPFLKSEGLDFDSVELNIDPATGVAKSLDPLLNLLPQSEQVIVTKNRLSIKGPYGLSEEEYGIIEKAKQTRADALREELEKEITSYEKSKLQARISRLTDGIAYINIGAVSDIEYIEKQHRIQDSLYSVKSASEEGIIPGGGCTLLFISNALKDVVISEEESIQLGFNIILAAIKVPFNQILCNVGIEPKDSEIKTIEQNFNVGIDAREKKLKLNLIDAGIIDAVKVTRIALENASSIAGMLLTTDCAIVDKSVYSKQKQYNL